jgi:quercetin dioxygenase-like cupin family protein
MNIRNYKKLDAVKNPHGIQSRKLLDRDYAEIMHLLLMPGEELKPHITPVDVTFYVLEGSPTVLIGEEKEQVSEEDLIESPKDIVHCLYNHSEKPVRVLVIKTPKPVKPTRFVENS